MVDAQSLNAVHDKANAKHGARMQRTGLGIQRVSYFENTP